MAYYSDVIITQSLLSIWECFISHQEAPFPWEARKCRIPWLSYNLNSTSTSHPGEQTHTTRGHRHTHLLAMVLCKGKVNSHLSSMRVRPSEHHPSPYHWKGLPTLISQCSVFRAPWWRILEKHNPPLKSPLKKKKSNQFDLITSLGFMDKL